MSKITTDYARWRSYDYRPTVVSFLPNSLVPLLPRGASVLDVGCREGAVCRFLAAVGFETVGVDINPNSIAAAEAVVDDRSAIAPVFHVADFLTLDLGREFDAVTLSRVLTCFPELADWRRMLARARGAVKEGGLLYVHDFLYDPTNPAYRDRYEEGIARGWRRGCFEVRSGDEVAFVAFHHDEEALTELESGYKRVFFSVHGGTSMTGNAVRMFEFIGRK